MTLLGTSKLPSILKNPFEIDKVTQITLSYHLKVFSKKPEWWGRVEFINGNTCGEQKFDEYETLEALYTDVRQFLSTL